MKVSIFWWTQGHCFHVYQNIMHLSITQTNLKCRLFLYTCYWNKVFSCKVFTSEMEHCISSLLHGVSNITTSDILPMFRVYIINICLQCISLPCLSYHFPLYYIMYCEFVFCIVWFYFAFYYKVCVFCVFFINY